MSNTNFLDRVYGVGDAQKTKAFYDEWAASYETELSANGYVTPGRCAEALASIDPDRAGPVIDLGCGTGLSGLALRAAGFEVIDGVDFSPEMLAAAQRHGCYRDLRQADLSAPFEAKEPVYAHAVAAGVLNPGHAPAETIIHTLNLLTPGGAFVFSLNDHALADSSFEARINDVVDGGSAELVFKEYGPHIPATGLNAMVYGVRKR